MPEEAISAKEIFKLTVICFVNIRIGVDYLDNALLLVNSLSHRDTF